MTRPIEVRDVQKTYRTRRGKIAALRGLSFDVEAAQIAALLGHNGAGKTTILSILQGVLRSDAGTVAVFGAEPTSVAARRACGYQFQTAEYLERSTCVELVELFARLHEVDVDARADLADVGLLEKAGSRVAELSGGQKQRLGLAVAMVHRPALLILDEPTTGLDPEIRRQIWDLIRNRREQGVSILLSTHNMAEAESLADQIIVIDEGQLVLAGPTREVVNAAAATCVVRFRTIAAAWLPDAIADPGLVRSAVSARVGDHDDWSISVSNSYAAIKQVLDSVPQEAELAMLEVLPASLEDLFVSVTRSTE